MKSCSAPPPPEHANNFQKSEVEFYFMVIEERKNENYINKKLFLDRCKCISIDKINTLKEQPYILHHRIAKQYRKKKNTRTF